jgi:hypothetical protein
MMTKRVKISKKEFAERMHVSNVTVWRWIKAGLIQIEPDGKIDFEVAADRIERKRKGMYFLDDLGIWIDLDGYLSRFQGSKPRG